MILPAGASKGAGLERLLGICGYSPRNLVAFGDGENDLSLLELGEFGVAVADAVSSLKAVADMVTTRPGPAGVLEVLEAYWLNSLTPSIPLRRERQILHFLAEYLGQFGLRLIDTKIDIDCITISASAASLSASCPQCHHDSSKVHSGYVRTLADLSLGARKVVVHLDVRCFFCKEQTCKYATFAEPVSEFAVRHARRSNQLRKALCEIAFESGGREVALWKNFTGHIAEAD